MDDPADRLSNWCADLVSLTKLEAGMVRLLRDTPAGTWVSVRRLYQTAGASGPDHDALAASWLPSPNAESGYAVVVFSDPGWLWSTTADYNAARLLGPGITAAAG